MPENKRVSFGIDASQVKIKELLGKDFLELVLRTVSSACPNRNGSCFTKEAQEKALPTYENKPILGYFENDDFTSHDGVWRHDPETGMDYWDTIGTKGERILGVVRSQDSKQVIYDEKDGLYWTEITCALWTQYSYKQVKRLLKDAMKANGGQAKNISVEVDLTDYEDKEIDGKTVTMIYDYNLVGITILGSRNGKKVEPGVADAGLRILNFATNELYNKQYASVRAAYAKLEEEQKEIEMPNQDNDTIITQPENIEHDEEICAKCGNAMSACTCGKTGENEEEHCGEGEEHITNEENADSTCPEENKPETNSCPEEAHANNEDNGEGEEDEHDDDEDQDHGDDSKDGEDGEGDEHEDESAKMQAHCAELEARCEALEKENCELKAKCEASENECLSLKEQCSKVEEECGQYREQCEAHSDYDTVKANYEAEKAAKEELEFKIFSSEAKVVLEEHKDQILKEDFEALVKGCENKEFASIDALKEKVTFCIGKAAFDNKQVTTSAFSAPVPNMPMVKKTPEAEIRSTDPFRNLGYKAKK